MGNVLNVTIIESKYIENTVGWGWGKMSQGTKAGHLPQLSKIRLLLPYLTMNRPGSAKPSEAREQIPKEKYLKIFLKMSHHNIQQSRPSSSCIFTFSFI